MIIMMKFQSIKPLTHRKGYIYDGSNELHKQINLVKMKMKNK